MLNQYIAKMNALQAFKLIFSSRFPVFPILVVGFGFLWHFTVHFVLPVEEGWRKKK
jgi:hypothetical protein